MLRGFKNFLMQGDLIVIAVGLVVALAFSTLIHAFTDNIITPLVNAAGAGAAGEGLGWTINGQRIDLGAFIGALIYLISQSEGMADRNIQQAQVQRAEMDDYVRSVATNGGGAAAG